MHLALINIAHARFDLTDPRIAEFVDNLDRVNAAAERSPGFVWRLIGDEGANATSINAFGDSRIIINMAVWESVEALEDFTYKTIHKRFFARRSEWFQPLDGPNLALWWVEPGATPTVEEGKRRLGILKTNGPSPEAFLFGNGFEPPNVAPSA